MARKVDVGEARRRQADQLVAGGMDVSQWCELNKVGKVALCDWLKVLRGSDSDVFGSYDIAHASDGRHNWYEHVRKAIRPFTVIGHYQESYALFRCAL